MGDKIDSLRDVIKNQGDMIKSQDDQIKSQGDMIDSLQVTIKNQSDVIKNQGDVINSLTVTIKNQSDSISSQHVQIYSQNDRINVQDNDITILKGDVSVLSLDVAVIFAGQLVSRVLGHTQESSVGSPCQCAIRNQNNPDHWGQNFVKFIRENFATDWVKQMKYAEKWDQVRRDRIVASHPDLLTDYNEEKAVKLISMLERTNNAHSNTILDILKARDKFLNAEPCPDLRPARGQ